MKVSPRGGCPTLVLSLLAVAMLGLPCVAWAGAGVNVTISGNSAVAVIELPGVTGTELTLTFDDPQNLTPANLDISAAGCFATSPRTSLRAVCAPAAAPVDFRSS